MHAMLRTLGNTPFSCHDACGMELFWVVPSRVIVRDVMKQREITKPPDEGVPQRKDHEGFTCYIT
jgi:hypothetical protein